MNPTTFENFDRVTSVLSAFSGIDKIPRHILDEAALRGTAVHEEIQAIQSNLWIPGSDDHVGYIDSYRKWAKDKKFIENPGRLYDLDLKLTGELDALYKLEKNTYSLVDFKTTAPKFGAQLAKFKRIWGMQLSAYAYMANKSGFSISTIELVQLSKLGDEPKVFDLTIDKEQNKEMFFKCLEIYREFFKGKKPDPEDYSWI